MREAWSSSQGEKQESTGCRWLLAGPGIAEGAAEGAIPLTLIDLQRPEGSKLGRSWLKGTLSNAMHAVLCGAGHNTRLIINKLESCQPMSPAY
jgi:hypothetical protein